MAFLGKIELQQLLPSCIEPFDIKRTVEAAYELCLGNEVYVTDSKSEKKEILDDKNAQVVIKPGQFALLLTQETVNIPLDKLAFISIKFSQKLKGLVNVSGFHIDPGFKGKVIFSVYNAASATIILDKGSPYFMIWFSELTSGSASYSGKHQNQSGISAEQISALRGELASPNVLLDRIKGNETLLNNLKWIAGILITLSITIIGLAITFYLKSSSDISKFNEGYNVGVKEKEARKYIDKAFNSYNVDSLMSLKVDSILKRQKIEARDAK